MDTMELSIENFQQKYTRESAFQRGMKIAGSIGVIESDTVELFEGKINSVKPRGNMSGEFLKILATAIDTSTAAARSPGMEFYDELTPQEAVEVILNQSSIKSEFLDPEKLLRDYREIALKHDPEPYKPLIKRAMDIIDSRYGGLMAFKKGKAVIRDMPTITQKPVQEWEFTWQKDKEFVSYEAEEKAENAKPDKMEVSVAPPTITPDQDFTKINSMVATTKYTPDPFKSKFQGLRINLKSFHDYKASNKADTENKAAIKAVKETLFERKLNITIENHRPILAGTWGAINNIHGFEGLWFVFKNQHDGGSIYNQKLELLVQRPK